MNNFGRSIVAALLFTGALALGGCEGDTTSGGSTSVFGSGTTTTTVGTGIGPSGQVVLVRLGTDNLVQPDPPNNKKLWVALVTDTNGRPVAGAAVIFALRSGTAFNPGRFLKGFYVLPPPAPAPQLWNQFLTAICPNEDVNFDDILDPGEDLNGNGLLDPPGVAGVNPTGVTDAFGFAPATVAYPKNYASWAELTLEASTGGAGGTPATATFFLDGLASDYANLGVSPPGDVSPFGVSASCANAL